MRTLPRIFSVAVAAVVAAAAPAFSAGENRVVAPAERSGNDWVRAAFSDGLRDGIIANVNGKIVMLGDLRRETTRYIPEVRRSASSQRDFYEKIDALAGDTVRSLTDTLLLVSAFDDSGAVMDENYIEQRINDLIESEFDGDRAKYLQMLRQSGSNPLADKRRMRDRIKAASWDDRLVRPAYNDISPAKVRAEYEARIEEFRSPASVEYAQIVLFAGASETDAQVEELAARLQKQIASGEVEFGDAAKIHSRDDYRAAGGYVGWKPLADLSEQIVPVLEKTPAGGVSDVVCLDAPSGKVFVILKKIAFREAGITPLKDVRALIENRLRSENARRIRAEKMAELRDEYFVQYY